MKIKLAVALAAFLSVASLEAQQKYMLPIGGNVNNRPAKVSISIGNNDIADWGVFEAFDYTPAMGDLETVLRNRFQILAKKFVVAPNSTEDEHGLGITVEPGPGYYARFHLREGTIPPEVLEVKLDYGLGTGWKLQGITDIKMRLFKGGDVVKYYSTKDGVGPDSPCEIGATKEVLAYGYASVRGQYGFPWLKENWWDMGEITIESFDGWATFFNANSSPRDGELIAVSEPPPAFLDSLRVPEMSQAPVLTISQPHISRIARSGNTTEITVSAESSSSVHLEFAEAIGGTWSTVSAYPVPLSLKSGDNKFTHTTGSSTTFYRLRFISSPQ